jgi:hypothetical protein
VLVPLRELMVQQWVTRVHNPMSLAEMSGQTIFRPPCRLGKVASDLLRNGRDGRILTGDPLTPRHESGAWAGLRESGGEPPAAESSKSEPAPRQPSMARRFHRAEELGAANFTMIWHVASGREVDEPAAGWPGMAGSALLPAFPLRPGLWPSRARIPPLR